MKKITFYLALFLTSIFLRAQHTSFEASEDYIAGESVDGVDGWQETTNYFVVSNVKSSEGENSLKMSYDPNQPLIFANWTFPEALPVQDNLEISLDIYAPGGMSTYYWKIMSNNEYAAYIIIQEGFVFPAVVNVVNPVPIAMAPINVGEFNAIKLIFNYTDQTITYFANGDQIHQDTLWGSQEAIDEYSFEVFLFEDMYMDNLQTNGLLGIDKIKDISFTHYIQNTNLHLQSSVNIEQIEIYDISGKLIHSQILRNPHETMAISALNSGVYIARLKMNGLWQSFKFVK